MVFRFIGPRRQRGRGPTYCTKVVDDSLGRESRQLLAQELLDEATGRQVAALCFFDERVDDLGGQPQGQMAPSLWACRLGGHARDSRRRT
jgi:hypothetical protein